MRIARINKSPQNVYYKIIFTVFETRTISVIFSTKTKKITSSLINKYQEIRKQKYFLFCYISNLNNRKIKNLILNKKRTVLIFLVMTNSIILCFLLILLKYRTVKG